MKTIGILGGMSWESTTIYYRLINEGIKEHLGGLHSAKILLYSFDFAEIEALQAAGEWDKSGELLAKVSRNLQDAGADCLLIGTNTMHLVADQVQAALDIPLLHIADATGTALQADDIKKAGLLGTRFTMEQDFYRKRIADKFGIEVIIPPEQQRETVHQVIYNELVLGKIKDASRAAYLEVIDALSEQGAEAIILGCTEIPMLVTPQHTAISLYDTTAIHAAQAVQFAIAK